VVKSVAVHDGDRVAAGTTLFTWRNESLEAGEEFIATAEVTGRISGLALKEGDRVSLGQRVMRLDELGRLHVVATVTPKNAKSFRADEPVTLAFDHVTLPGVVSAVEGSELMVDVDSQGQVLDSPSMTGTWGPVMARRSASKGTAHSAPARAKTMWPVGTYWGLCAPSISTRYSPLSSESIAIRPSLAAPDPPGPGRITNKMALPPGSAAGWI
jgi:hypothetical protein